MAHLLENHYSHLFYQASFFMIYLSFITIIFLCIFVFVTMSNIHYITQKLLVIFIHGFTPTPVLCHSFGTGGIYLLSSSHIIIFSSFSKRRRQTQAILPPYPKANKGESAPLRFHLLLHLYFLFLCCYLQ